MATKPTSSKRQKQGMNVWRVFFLLALMGVIIAGGVGAGFVIGALRDLPALSSIEPKPSLTSMVYGADGKVIAKLHAQENRTPIRLSQMPKHLRDAAIAIEDHQFYDHKGINFRGMARALWVNLRGRAVHGGSTITQQLAKNAFLSNEVTMKRKIQDIILALELERRFTKDEILEMYLNQIPFGNGAYGIEAASQLYFAKSASELTIGEAALLMGVTNWPVRYDPYRNLPATLERQRVVLDEMLRLKFISAADHKKAVETQIKIAPQKKPDQEVAAHFTDYIINYLLPKYGKEQVYNGGLQVYTTLDQRIQKAAEDAVKKVLDPAFPLKPNTVQPEAAVLVMDVRTGYIKAMVGGRTHTKRLELNRAVQAKRQPGSAFKPLVVYGAAMEMGISPVTVIDDVPIEYAQKGGPVWIPENYDNKFHGLVTVRESLEHSYNVPAVRVLERIGVKKGVDFAVKLGIQSLITDSSLPKNDLNLSTALGGLTEGVTPWEMVTAFGTYAGKGVRTEPLAVLKVLDKDGRVLEESKPKRQPAISEDTAYMVTNLLEGAVLRGTGTRANIGRPVAGKTGTTSDYRDAWFVGYSPDLVAAVWMGFDKDQTMERWKVTGGSYPAQIWQRTMLEAHKGVPVSSFAPVRSVSTVTVCTKSGKLPGPFCPAETARTDIVQKGIEIVDTCDVHVPVVVCAHDPERLSTPWCPSRITKSFIRRPVPHGVTEEKNLPLDAGQEVPTEYCRIHGR